MNPTLSLTLKSTALAAAVGAAFYAGCVTRSGAGNGHARRERAAVSATAMAAASPLEKMSAGRAKADAEKAAKVLATLTPEQVTARMKEIFDTEDPIARMDAYLDFLRTLKDNGQMQSAAATMLENFNPRERGREYQMLMTLWGKQDPVAALAFSHEKKGWTGNWGASTVLADWVKREPDTAIAWARENGKEMDASEDGNWYMTGLIGGLAKSDPDRAAKLAESMGRSRARGDAMDRVLDGFFKNERGGEAKTWAAALAEGPFKEGLMNRLAGRLADQNVSQALTWAEALPDGGAKPQALSQVISKWAREEPNAAGEWLNGQPLTPAMDDPRETFARRIEETDPEAAIAWAGTISDEGRRSRMTRELTRNWMQREPDAARQWISNSAMPSEVKERLLRRRG